MVILHHPKSYSIDKKPKRPLQTSLLLRSLHEDIILAKKKILKSKKAIKALNKSNVSSLKNRVMGFKRVIGENEFTRIIHHGASHKPHNGIHDFYEEIYVHFIEYEKKVLTQFYRINLFKFDIEIALAKIKQILSSEK